MIPLISPESPAIFHDEIQPCQVSLQGRRGLGHGREGAGRAEVGRGGGCQWHRGPRGGFLRPQNVPRMGTDANWWELIECWELNFVYMLFIRLPVSVQPFFLVASHSYPKLDSVCPKVWRPFLASKRFSGTAVAVTIIGSWSNTRSDQSGNVHRQTMGAAFPVGRSIGDPGTQNVATFDLTLDLPTCKPNGLNQFFLQFCNMNVSNIVFIIMLLFVFMHTHAHTHIYTHMCVC